MSRFGHIPGFKGLKCTWSVGVTDPTAVESVALNTRSILSSRFRGRGRSGIEEMCALLNLPPPLDSQSYLAEEEVTCRSGHLYNSFDRRLCFTALPVMMISMLSLLTEPGVRKHVSKSTSFPLSM